MCRLLSHLANILFPSLQTTPLQILRNLLSIQNMPTLHLRRSMLHECIDKRIGSFQQRCMIDSPCTTILDVGAGKVSWGEVVADGGEGD